MMISIVAAFANLKGENVRSRDNMKLVALSVGGPREVEWRGEMVRTSIFKERVTGARHVAPD